MMKALPQIILVIAMLAAGQILFRRAALAVPPLRSAAGITSLFLNPIFLLALLIYGVATLLWVGVLQKVPLWQAYPFMALGFIVVPVAAMLTDHTLPSPRFVLGLLLVMGGLVLIGGRA